MGAECAKVLGQEEACDHLKDGEGEGSLVCNDTREQRGSRVHGTSSLLPTSVVFILRTIVSDLGSSFLIFS